MVDKCELFRGSGPPVFPRAMARSVLPIGRGVEVLPAAASEMDAGWESRPLEALLLTLNFYRDAELQGARLLLNLHRHLRDPESQVNLTRHLADETRHAWLWTKRMVELGGTPTAVASGYQRRMGRLAGVPRDVMELLALTIVAEKRAIDRYRRHAARSDVDAGTLEVLKAVTGDEQWHLAWVEQKLRDLAEANGQPQRTCQLLERYQAVDREVYATFEADEARLLGG
jgi:bacterioferritin (cytochrome b1)